VNLDRLREEGVLLKHGAGGKEERGPANIKGLLESLRRLSGGGVPNYLRIQEEVISPTKKKGGRSLFGF